MKLTIDLNHTILHLDKDNIDLLDLFLKDKTLELCFIDNRGNIKYTLTTKAEIISTVELNTTEDNTIEKGTYKLSLTLIDDLHNLRTNLLLENFDVYVK